MHTHVPWYSRERMVKTDKKEKKLLNKVVIFIFFVHKDHSRCFVKLRLNVTWTILMMSLLPFWSLNMSIALLSMQDQRAVRFNQKYDNLKMNKGLMGLEWHEGE